MIVKKYKQKGNVAIILCFVITAIFGFTAYVADIGLVYADRIKLYNAVDSAALASVLELPGNPTNAVTVAKQYLQDNGVDSNTATITVGSDNKSIQISTNKNIKYIFAPLIGINSSSISVRTKAVVGPLSSISGGIRPFAVVSYNFSYGTQVTLKVGAGSGYAGNYCVLALGGNGSSVYKANALYGYNGKLSVGDWVDTEPGNMTGTTNQINNYISSENSTFNNFPRNSIRLWVVPLVNTLQVNGRNQVLITGFGEFYVENAKNSGGKMQLTGRFIKYVSNGSIDTTLNDTGAYSAKLSN